jgi:mRNA-degrading endonuclease toxin of MazEF toxin-antitoxin module
VELDRATSGLDAVSHAKCEEVTSVSEPRVVARLGTTNDEARFALSRALRFLLNF